MPRRYSGLLLHAEELQPTGNRLMHIDRRLEKRAQEVRAEMAEFVTKNEVQTLPPVHSLIYARQRKYRNTDIPPRTISETVSGLRKAAEDIYSQDYPGRLGKIVAVVNADPDWHSEYEEVAALDTMHLVTVEPTVSHPRALNTALEEFAEKDGLLWMTEVGARAATSQAFSAGALAIRNDVVAIQGTGLADRNAGTLEAAFYNTATLHPAFLGHAPREAQKGMGYLARERSIISLDALQDASQRWGEGSGNFGPFDPAYGNGGFEGQLGERFTQAENSIRMDWAASAIVSDSLGASQMSGLLRHEWPSYAQPNDYINPGTIYP